MDRPPRKLTARWTVDTIEKLRRFYNINEKDIVWCAISIIEDERKKSEAARSSQNKRNPKRL